MSRKVALPVAMLALALGGLLLGELALGWTCAATEAAPQKAAPRAALARTGAGAAVLRVLSDRLLPPSLVNAQDVRWATDRTVFMPLLRQGTAEVAIDQEPAVVVKEWVPGEASPGGFFFATRVAASPQYLVVTAPMYGLTWKARTPAAQRREASFDLIASVDVRGDQLLVLGDRRDDKGIAAADGAIAFLGSLAKDAADLRPVLFDATGPLAKKFQDGYFLDIGAVRFLGDGRFLIVPGVQPGVHLFDGSGKLQRSWDSASLGLDTSVALSEREADRIRLSVEPRDAWLSRRRVVDDILPLVQGPALIVRTGKPDGPQWELKVLGPDGWVRTAAIPVKALSDRARLRGDVRGGKIVLIMTAYKEGGMQPERPRLIVAETPP
jgi:hypothetical protein